MEKEKEVEKEVIFAIYREAEMWRHEVSARKNFNTFITLCSECRVASIDSG